jgi:hypothetical protein
MTDCTDTQVDTDTDTVDASGHTVLIMWDDYGIELIHDVTAAEQEEMWRRLSEPENSSSNFESAVINLNHLLLRARLNSHRHYEIYLIVLGQDITVEYIQTLFEQHRDAMVDLIRERGTCLHNAEHFGPSAPRLRALARSRPSRK